VIIGVGQVGIDVVQKFRRQVVDRYGSFERLAHLRLICVDTDPESLQTATSPNSPAPLAAGELVPMRLNRASHYLKPRRNGRSLIEGWFEPQTLYRIPRNPQTLGLRSLGRLAFCDHYRTFATKLNDDLEACMQTDAMARADKILKLGMRSNRPRVYIVAGLGGGTGSGMFIDIAYAAKHRLKLLGFSDPEVIGLLLAPCVDRNSLKPQAVGNAFAALKELNHFSLPETVFSASYDDKDGAIRDTTPPCKRVHIVPLEPLTGKPGENAGPDTAIPRAADFLRRNLLTILGRVADESRGEYEKDNLAKPVTASIPNQASYLWPKQLILSNASRWLGEAMVTRWLKADVNAIREPVRNWLKERWSTEELGPEPLIAKLQKCAEKAAGQPLDNLLEAEVQQFIPRGWFARDPDSTKLWQTVSRLLQVVGMPDERAMQRQVGQMETALDEAADNLAREMGPKLLRLPRTLLEHPDYRLSGAEEGIEQLQAILTKLLEHYEPLAVDAANKSIEAYYIINSYLTAEHGRRKASASEIAECLKNFPKWRFQSLVFRQVCRVYMVVRGQLADFTREIRFCRQRLEDLMTRFRLLPVETGMVFDTSLFPKGCSSVEQAVQSLRESIRPDELRSLDKTLQRAIEHSYQALFSVCMSSINMLGNLHSIIEEHARSFLSQRLGELNVGEMFFAKYNDAETSVRAVKYIYDRAMPPVQSNRPVSKEVCIVAVPEGEQNPTFQQVARSALQGRMIDFTTSAEEILVYREWPRVPLITLPQLSPLAEDAYNQMQQASPGSPHTRNDMGRWFDIDG
jgi:hypothetical protein